MSPVLDIPPTLADLCCAHHIQRLAVFGSVLTGTAIPDSDLDLLVEFLPNTRVGLSFITIQDELSDLFGRPGDLNTPNFLSKYFRNAILAPVVDLYTINQTASIR